MRFLKPKPEAGREQLRKDSWWLIQPIENRRDVFVSFCIGKVEDTARSLGKNAAHSGINIMSL